MFDADIRAGGAVRKADIAALCPDISLTTIERTLQKLTREGFILKVGRGPATAYIRQA